MGHACMHHAQNNHAWDVVIMTLKDVLSPKDMEHLKGHWDEEGMRPGFHRLDEAVYDTWKALFVGGTRDNIIMHGVSGGFQEEEITECEVFPKHFNPEESDDDCDVVAGCPFYLASQMMSTYFEWLHLHPKEEAIFEQGFMVSFSLSSLSLFVKALLRLEALQKYSRIHTMEDGNGWRSTLGH